MGFIVTGWNQTIIALMVSSIFRKNELIKIKLLVNLITVLIELTLNDLTELESCFLVFFPNFFQKMTPNVI